MPGLGKVNLDPVQLDREAWEMHKQLTWGEEYRLPIIS